MNSLYSQPLKVYVLLAVLAAAGLYSGLRLPISLFPNSSKPTVNVRIGYGSATPEEFQQSYGDNFEAALRGISSKAVEVETTFSLYGDTNVDYTVEFKWGSDPDTALKEVETIVSSWTPRFPEEVRDAIGMWSENENGGFFASSFYSDRRSLDEVYELLDSALRSKLATVRDAGQVEIWNPERKEIRIVLRPETMAALALLPRDIEQAVATGLLARRGGSVTVGTQDLTVQMPRTAKTPDDLALIPIVTPSGKVVSLADVAAVDFGPRTGDQRLNKTSGAPSVLIFASPRPGGNIKRMSEEILAIVDEARRSLPPDLQHRVLVDPSQFIQSAVNNVFHEVALGALLAVGILFIFIGSLRNVVTAAIEIPLSIVLAFILMKMFDVNINLISLGGLALSAGMNVDGSVVVMENIFRHFGEQRGRVLSRSDKLRILTAAVVEVRLPLIASTLASLVVFLPLTFTSALSYAILGDLAKAVVFSHGFSAIVALILVPTVRLQMMRRETSLTHSSRFEPALAGLDRAYARLLGGFLRLGAWKWLSYAALAAALAALVIFVLPRLPREVIGTPDSDMVFVAMNTKGNTVMRQMEALSDEVEARLFAELGSDIDYTFTQIRGPNRASILARLKDKSRMQAVTQAMEEKFKNTPTMQFFVQAWNPSELPIPDPPALRVAVRGGDIETRRDVALEISDLLEGGKIFDRVQMQPNVERARSLDLILNADQWAALARDGVRLTPADLTDLARVATVGRKAAAMTVAGREVDVMLRYPDGYVQTPEDLQSLPVGVGAKIVPLKALVPFKSVERRPQVFRENAQDLYVVSGRQNMSGKRGETVAAEKARAAIARWQEQRSAKLDSLPKGQPIVVIEDPGKDVTEAINQLGTAVFISIGLIFLVLLLQFGSIAESLLVLVAVPLGFIGVIGALYLTGSTLSLNSALGVILLNGIAVNNSIIMVDFIRRLHADGRAPRAAALEAAQKRLRPILITSLATCLGMLPIAFGYGEGGRILQPLGIAVSGGLWISMALTLFLVPALQVSWLEWLDKRAARRVALADQRPADVAVAT